MSFLKSKALFFMALFLSFVTYGSHISNSGIVLNETANSIIANVAPGGLSDFVTDSYEEDGFVIFTIALPAAGVTSFNPDTDVTVVNGTIDHHDFYDWGEDTVYYEFSMNSSSSNVSNITMSVSENAFFVNGIGNQAASLVHSVEGVDPVSGSVDRAALMAIYNANGGVNWRNTFEGGPERDHNTNWGTDAPLGDWYGVTVNNDERVTVLRLPTSNVIGDLAPEVGSLEMLELLDLGRNDLTSLPESIGSLKNLITIRFGYNNLISLPVGIGNADSLESLGLGNNNLSSIPESIGDLNNLSNLNLSNNEFSLFPESVAGINNLEHLYFGYNNLVSVAGSIGNLDNLISLDLSNNDLVSLSGSIIDLDNLGILFLNNNNLQFNDLESIVEAFSNISLTYFGQETVGEVQSLSVNGGASITLNNPLVSTNNSYQWFKDGVALGVTTKNLVINNATSANAGVYHFTSTNSVVGNLTLTSEPITITVNGGEEGDRAALMAIYNATGGPNWINNSGWGSQEPIDNWHGVGFNAAGDFVSLILNSNNLEGDIPNEIGDLENLTRLLLSNNNITSLPESVENLENLSEVNLSDNELNSVPDGIFNTFYFSLNLSNNNLTSSSVDLARFRGRVLLIGGNNLESLPNVFNIRTTFLRLGLQNNNLQFNDLEPMSRVLGNMTNEYTPQQNIDVVNSQSVNEGGNVTLSNPLTSANNSYQWFKDGVALGVTTKNLVISNATAANAGVYHFEATNSIITDLTLVSESITLTVNGGGNSEGITDFIVDSYEEDEFIVFTFALPTEGVTGFNPVTDATVVNGTIDHQAFFDWGEETVYYEVYVNPVSPSTTGEDFDVTMSVFSNSFFVNGVANQTASFTHLVEGSVTAQNFVSNQFQNLLIPTQVSLVRESSNLLFPNPANIGDNVSIRDIEANTVHVEVLNMGNILIREETVQVRNNTYTFNTSNLSSGIYIVKITNTENNRTVTKRMVIGSSK